MNHVRDKGTFSDPQIEAARISAKAAVIVALITAISSFIVTAMVVLVGIFR